MDFILLQVVWLQHVCLFLQARRSLVFAKHLRLEADRFRAEVLNSTDESDRTPYNDENWWKQIPVDGSALGGSYLAVHLRRGDFLYGHSEEVPSIKAARKQIKMLIKKHDIKAVFLATDGTDEGKRLCIHCEKNSGQWRQLYSTRCSLISIPRFEFVALNDIIVIDIYYNCFPNGNRQYTSTFCG